MCVYVKFSVINSLYLYFILFLKKKKKSLFHLLIIDYMLVCVTIGL